MMSGSFDPAAAANSRRLPVESAMPGTTLQLIPLSAFSGSGDLYGMPSALLKSCTAAVIYMHGCTLRLRIATFNGCLEDFNKPVCAMMALAQAPAGCVQRWAYICQI